MAINTEEYDKLNKYFRGAGILSFFVLLLGSIVYHFIEKLSWLDSIYLSVITLSTVGYGDITPKTSAGKIFTMFYILIGIGIIATLANLLIKRAAFRREFRQTNAKKKSSKS